MKKLLLSILTIFYMTVSSGIAMEIHYCMGQKSGMDFYKTTEESKCGRCGMKGKKGCCNDEHKFYKLATDHQTVVNDHNFDAPFVAMVPAYQVYHTIQAPVSERSYPLANAPPDSGDTPIYVRNCNFRL